jgi:hypothetical protein
MYSPIVTAKMNVIDPQAWLTDILARIPAHPPHRLDELLPLNWTPTSSVSARGHDHARQDPSRHHHHPGRERRQRKDEDWLWDVANEMEIEDGVIWVYGVGEDGIQAFTDFGIENLIELIRFYKENLGLLRR